MAINAKQNDKNSFEVYVGWFFQELKEAGYIQDYYFEPETIRVMDKAVYKRYDVKKTKANVEDFNILPEDNYTYDYLVIWNEKAKDIFFNLLDGTPVKTQTPFYSFRNQNGQFVTVHDVKPAIGASTFGNQGSAFTFPVKQKIIYYKFGIFVNKTIPIPYVSQGRVKSGNASALFTACFCPKRYYFTDGGGQVRKINFRTQSLEQYVVKKQAELTHVNNLTNTLL